MYQCENTLHDHSGYSRCLSHVGTEGLGQNRHKFERNQEVCQKRCVKKSEPSRRLWYHSTSLHVKLQVLFFGELGGICLRRGLFVNNDDYGQSAALLAGGASGDLLLRDVASSAGELSNASRFPVR